MVTLEDGTKAWAFGSSQCVQTAAQNVRECVEKREGWKWTSQQSWDTPIATTHRPDLDISDELDEVTLHVSNH